MKRIESLEGKLFTLWEDMAEARGFDRVTGRVLFTLLIEETALSQQEIAEKTGYSIPTISKTMKGLVSSGSVRKTKKPRERSTLYYVEMYPWEMMSGALTRWTLSAKTMQQRIVQITQDLEQLKHDNTGKVGKIMKHLTNFAFFIPKMVNIIETAIEDINREARV